MQVRCNCKKILSIPDSYAGKKVKCPACGVVLNVPMPAEPVEATAEPTPPAATAPTAEMKTCPHCGGQILATANKCRHCKQWLNAAAPEQTSPATAAEKAHRCCHCGGEILASAKKCKHCKQWLVAPDSRPTSGDGLLMSPDSPPGAVDGGQVALFAADLQAIPGEQVFFFQKTNSYPDASAGMAGVIPCNYHLMVSNRRVVAIAKDKNGKIASHIFPVEQIKVASTTKGAISHYIEMVVADPKERLVRYEFTAAVKQELVRAAVEFLGTCKGGFEDNTTVVTSAQREARIAKYQQEWEARRADLPVRMAAMFSNGETVVVGAQHPDFEAWITQNMGAEEKVAARCYSGDEALIVTTDKVILLKKGTAKAAVSASGAGVGDAVGAAGILGSDSLLGMVGGLVAGAAIDIAVGYQGVIAKTVDYYNLTSIDCTKGMMFGHIEFTYPGAKEVRTGGFVEGAVSENVFQFLKELYDYIVPVANEVRRRMKLSRQPQQVVIQAQQAESIPDQIKKLAELKAAGILTEEEFQAKKKELLAKM